MSRRSTPLRLLSALPLFASLLSQPLSAQVNIESLRREDPPEGLSGSLSGDLNVTTGNIDFVAFNASARLNRVRGSLTELLIGQGGLGFLGRDRFATSGLFHYRQTFWLKEWFAPEWYAQVDYDRTLELDLRTLAGSGVRFDFARGAWGHVGAGVSVMLEHERLDVPPTAVHDARTTVLRNSTFLSVRIVPGEHLVVSSTTYLQPSLANVPGDLRVLENMRVATALTDELALTITFDLRYDSDPPDDVSVLDTRTRMGVTFTY